jgi:hypothetical protein
MIDEQELARRITNYANQLATMKTSAGYSTSCMDLARVSQMAQAECTLRHIAAAVQDLQVIF